MNAVPAALDIVAPDWRTADLVPMAQDASSRRYSRLHRADGATAVLMDAPVDTAEDMASFAAFLTLADHLRRAGFSAPKIYGADPALGVALLEDLGQTSLAALLDADPDRARAAYSAAADVAAALEMVPAPPTVARPDLANLVAMVDVTLDQIELADGEQHSLKSALQDAVSPLADGPRALALRDFHADNLMWLPDRQGVARVGLLDFQDAVLLPVGYDLASVLDDPRRCVPNAWRNDLIAASADRWGVRTGQAMLRVNTLSLLRNVRILGIFRRLVQMQGRSAYAAFVPRTVALIRRCLHDPGLVALAGPVAAVLDVAQPWARAEGPR